MNKMSKWLLKGLTIVMAWNVSACSSGDDEPAAPSFPEAVQTITCEAESESNFSFNPNMEWKLSSNKAWCTLVSSVMEGQNISGQAGAQTIKVKTSAEGQDFESAKASLTLTMGGQSKVVAEIVRSGKAYELKVYDTEGNAVSALAVGTEGTLEFSVEANFEFGATGIPQWMQVELTSDIAVSGKKSGIIVVKDEYLKNPQASSMLTFANEKGTASFPIPVTYTGMDPKSILIQSVDIETGSLWGWTVSLDGKTFTHENDLTATLDEIQGKMTFQIKALNDAYSPVFIEEKDGKYHFEKVDWMHLTTDGETAVLTVDAATQTRSGLVMVFPQALYDEIKGNLEEQILEDGNIKYQYEQNNVLLQFTQKNLSESGFVVKNGLTQVGIECVPETNEEYLAYIASEYSVEEIYSVQVQPSTPIMIYPNLSQDEWDVSSLTSFSIYWLDGNGTEVTEEELGARPEGAMDGRDEQYMMIRTPRKFEKPIYIVFKGIDTLNKKVLIIKP